ncbi:MAG: tRNA lysidine(34) synthetase TilS [Prevotella sp.]|nr:tRNA lysidine(34) synthetase TilS [Prevotella sp.]
MKEIVRQFIEREGLLCKDSLHLVAVSGGADSVCLLLMLKELGYRVEAVHCNFKLRGEESDRDEAFVKRLCQQTDTELHLTHFDTKAYAELHQISIEMAARDLRYHYFEQLRQDIGADAICVAHHQDDSVETILMNLVRGTGLRGLQGIQPRRGHIVRPLLCLGREQIEEWLKQRGQDYVTDSTNLVPDIVRNQLRLNVIPQLKEACPQANANILTTARRIGEALRLYDSAVSQSLTRLVCNDSIDTTLLLQEPSAESLLFEWLSPKGFSPKTIEAIHDTLCQTTAEGSRQWSSGTHVLVSHRGRLTLVPIEPESPTLRLPEIGTYVYADRAKFRVSIVAGSTINKDSHVCCLDADKIKFPLTIRPTRQGDRFHPLGMKGSQLVSDFLTNRHTSPIEKRRQLVVCNADDTIVWLVGQRPDHHYRVTNVTAQTLRIDYLPK